MRKVPVSVMSMTLFHSSSPMSTTLQLVPRPALLISTSIPPMALSASEISA
jgi:hypothetical protein